jgi:hypothetical protein
MVLVGPDAASVAVAGPAEVGAGGVATDAIECSEFRTGAFGLNATPAAPPTARAVNKPTMMTT